jgi:hypothetical protein
VVQITTAALLMKDGPMNDEVPLSWRAVGDRRSTTFELGFQNAKVFWIQDEDGLWLCEVRDGIRSWGSVGVDWFDSGSSSPEEPEDLLFRTTEEVAENLWPDELTDPWPLFPVHHDHPLQPGFVDHRAAMGLSS